MVGDNSVDFGDELGDASPHADSPLSLALVRPEPRSPFDALVSGASS
jgi:hypothetical protein